MACDMTRHDISFRCINSIYRAELKVELKAELSPADPGAVMRRIDYNTEQYQDYARGRALTERQLRAWISAFAALLPERRPLSGLDVGSGTGRFTPALARAFGPVTGVEPSVRMREIAQAQSPLPGVRYLAGSAEDIPVPSGSADYALMFLSWHHVRDKDRAVRELARVLRPGGRLLMRSNFSDHIPPSGWWLEYFPRGFEVDAAMFQPLHEVIATFTSAGWRVASFGRVTEPSSGTREDMLQRLRLRTFSTFAQFTPEELETGFRRLEQAIAAAPAAPPPDDRATLLTLERPPGTPNTARSIRKK
jgi:ubiquinone/menaquinone biosynthesis C-methylase UbiE